MMNERREAQRREDQKRRKAQLEYRRKARPSLRINERQWAAVEESNRAHRLAGRWDQWAERGLPYRGPGLTMFGPAVLPMETPQDCRDRMAAELRETFRLASVRSRGRKARGARRPDWLAREEEQRERAERIAELSEQSEPKK